MISVYKVLLATLLIVFCCFVTGSLVAKEQENCLKFHVIRSDPFGFVNDQGKNQGVHWEYLTALEKLTGFCIDKILLPYPRVWRSIEKGDHDGGIMFKSESRSSNVEYVALVRTIKTVVIPVKGLHISHYNDLKNLVIGKTRGVHLSDQFDNDKNLLIVELKDYSQGVRMLKIGRIDAIAGSVLAINYQLKKHNVTDILDINHQFVVGEKEQWLQLSKKSIHIDKIPALTKAVEKLKHNGIFDSIMNKYYGEEWQQINQ